jgi:DHA2 family multidrug resistance protein-like MFS transporter
MPRRFWAMTTVGIAMGMASLDGAIANTALPTIAADLHTSAAASIWVVNAYQLALVVSLLPFSSLGEIIGYRRVYFIGLVVFTIGSLICGLSWSLASLTLARMVQGFGASGLMSVNTALIRFIFPTARLGRGYGTNALVVAVSFAVGPTVASAILSVAHWPWLFAVNVPFGLLSLALAPALPPTPRSGHRFDFASAALNAGGFGLLIFSLGETAHNATASVSVACFAVAVLLLGLLVWRQAAIPAPMLPVDLFRRPIFALSAVTSSCSFATQGLAFVSLPFFFQRTLGHTPVETGFLLTPWPVVVAIMAPIAGRLSDRYSAGLLGGGGLSLLCGGMVLLATLPAEPTNSGLIWRLAVCGAGFGFFQSPNQRALMASAPKERAGGASGIVSTARLLGQTTGAALVALCFGISTHGVTLALWLGAAFAGAGSLASFARLAAKR